MNTRAERLLLSILIAKEQGADLEPVIEAALQAAEARGVAAGYDAAMFDVLGVVSVSTHCFECEADVKDAVRKMRVTPKERLT